MNTRKYLGNVAIDYVANVTSKIEIIECRSYVRPAIMYENEVFCL